MTPLLRLPKKLLDLSGEVALVAKALAEAVAEAAIERVRGSANGHAAAPPMPVRERPPAPPRSRTEPVPAPAPAPVPPPPDPDPDPPPIAVVPEPTRGEAARIRAEQREAEAGEDSPGAVVRVDEPWRGYKAMKAPEIIDRLAVSDEAVRAVVLLYEGSHRKRKTVLEAAGA